jgi:DNA-3-methyladenine glycosylase II
VDDFGVREGFKRAYGRRTQPTPKQLRRYGERWMPYRSVASWYLWRAAEKALHRRSSRRSADGQAGRARICSGLMP